MQIPTKQELQALRTGLRKNKLPPVFDGMWCSYPGIGGVKLTASGTDFDVEWVIFDSNGIESDPQHAAWSGLCSDPNLEMQRLEIGLMVSEVLQTLGQEVMDSIGHPMEAYNEAKPYFDVAKAWKHWGIVKPGHMCGL